MADFSPELAYAIAAVYALGTFITGAVLAIVSRNFRNPRYLRMVFCTLLWPVTMPLVIMAAVGLKDDD